MEWTVSTSPGRGLLLPSPPKGREGDGKNNKGVGGGDREVYRPDVEKGWKSGQPEKDYGMDS